MKENYKILMLKKLLSSLLFDKYDIDFDIWDAPKEYIYGPKYGLTVKLDPEKVIMAGNEYNPSIGNLLFTFDDRINSLLSYVSMDVDDLQIQYEFINSEEFSDKLKQKVLKVLPLIYDEIPNLPKIKSIRVHPRSKSMPEFEVSLEFDFDRHNDASYDNYGNSFITTSNMDMKVFDSLHTLLPEFGDIYFQVGFN